MRENEIITSQAVCQIEQAKVVWTDEGLPQSALYGDIYFSHSGGVQGALAEKQAVFVAGTALPARFAAGLSTAVLELGFGTGLSFLCTAMAFLNAMPPATDAKALPVLHFYSIEKHPWVAADFLRLVAAWPSLLPLAHELAEQWPQPVPGFHRRYLAGGKIALTLVYADVETALKQLHGPFDAFYLDGFSPAKNAAMWQVGVFRALARLAGVGARLATYSAARAVAEGLMNAGFLVEKVPGFGTKKHQLVAKLRDMPRTRRVPPPPCPTEVVVIGAGAAGLGTALALRRRQIPVTVYEQASALGAGASGNPAGIVCPHLSLDCHAMTRLSLMAAGFMRAEIARLQQAGCALAADFSGVIALARDAAHAERQAEIAQTVGLSLAVARWCDADELSELAGVPLCSPGWWYPAAGWIAPITWLKAMQRTADISVRCSAPVARLVWRNGFWVGEQACGAPVFQSKTLVLANAEQAAALLPELAHELTVCRGQVSWFDAELSSAVPSGLRLPVMREGYALDLPAGAQSGGGVTRLFGASFKPNDTDLSIRADEQRENAARLAAICANLAPSQKAMQQASARVALRVTTRDRLPMVGALQRATLAPGLWLNVGHGARGLTWTALLGEVLAAQMLGEPNVLPKSLAQALSPNRLTTRRTR